MTQRLKIATIGGGSSYTPEIVEGFINKKLSGELPLTDLYLVDVPAGKEKLEIVGRLAQRMVEKANAKINIHLTYDRREALTGAHFVTTQFRVGLLDARIKDERIPLKYNLIGQETNGAGGFAKALRTIPVILDICREMEELCPDAWLVNFTNPSGMVTEAVLKHTNVKVLGLCNVPLGMKQMVADMYKVPMERIYIEFAGLNHFIWGRKILLDGKDITADVIDALAEGRISATMKNMPDAEWNPELLRNIGMLPCGYHRYYYMRNDALEKVKKESADKGVRAEVVKAVEDELFKLYQDPNLSEKPEQLSKRGGAHYSTAAVNLISAIYNDKRDIHIVNVRNNGTIADLPDDVAIECNCVITRDGAKPLNVGRMPLGARGMLQLQKAFEEMTVQAAVSGDYNTALHALTINPLVGDVTLAKSVLDDLIEAHKEFLPKFSK